MIKFELKKMIKSKKILIVILFAFIMTLYVQNLSKKIDVEKKYPIYPKGLYHESIFSEAVAKKEDELFNSKEFRDILLIGIHNRVSREEFNSYTKEGKEAIREKYQKDEIERIKKEAEYLKNYNIEIEDELARKAWEWTYYEYIYAENNGLDIRTTAYPYITTNLARVIIYNSSLLFGIPFLFLLIMLFYGSISLEREKGSLDLLRLTNLNSKQIIASKLFSVFCLLLTYIFSLMIFLIITSPIFGVEIRGFREIYRILSNQFNYIIAYQLIFKILAMFISIMMIFAVVLIILNKLIKKSESIFAISIILILGMIYLTNNYDVFKNRYNIFYAMDYMRLITGFTQAKFSINGDYKIIYNMAESEIYLYILSILSILIITLKDIDIFHCLFEFKRIKTNKIKNTNFFKFEIKKIIGNRTIYIFMVAILVVILGEFFKNNIYIESTKQNTFKSSNYWDEIAKDTEKELNDTRRKYLKEGMDIEDIEDNMEIIFLKESLASSKNNSRDYRELCENYLNSDGEKYYQVAIDLLNNFWKNYLLGENVYKSGQAHQANVLENEIKFNYAIEKNIKPVLQDTIIYSEYEEFVNSEVEKEMKNSSILLSGEGVFTLSRFIRNFNIDIIILIITSLIVTGYVLDKEYGRQIELIKTQPFNEYIYHIKRICVNVLCVSIFAIFIILFIICLASLFNGLGEINYPVIEYREILDSNSGNFAFEFAKSVSIIPIWQYLLRFTFILILQIAFIISLILLISIFSKNRVDLLIKFIFAIIIGISLNYIVNVDLLHLLNPFTYIKTGNIANNAILIKEEIKNASFNTSAYVISIWTLILSIFGSLAYKLKNQ